MDNLENTIQLIDGQDIEQSLVKLAEAYPGTVAFSTSLSLEDQVITHYILSNQIPIFIFTLDTCRLFKETYELIHRTNQKYNTHIQTFFPDYQKVETMVNTKGMYSFYDSVENRKECCFIRKVAPLNRALEGVKCWITGIRAEQSANRADLEILEWDAQRQLLKYQPLLHWSLKEVEDFIAQHNIPINSLHKKSFPSIGCEPCTRAVQEGEDIRAGRWWWENSKKECGLHTH
ncbi:MAG: phosphoadenylyl-sulfate reductase [Thermonemataceae bacterium]